MWGKNAVKTDPVQETQAYTQKEYLYQQFYAEMAKVVAVWLEREFSYFKSKNQEIQLAYSQSALHALSMFNMEALVTPEGRRIMKSILNQNGDIELTMVRLKSLHGFFYMKYGKAFMDELHARSLDAILYGYTRLDAQTEAYARAEVTALLADYPCIVLIPIYQQSFSPSMLQSQP
jgi:hypothetical protein